MASQSRNLRLKDLAAFYEPPSRRKLLDVRVGGVELKLSRSQAEVLDGMVGYAEEYLHKPVTVPLYIASETGAGKKRLRS